MTELKLCSRCVMDETTPDIWFDEQGICNYCYQFDAISQDSPNDDRGAEILNRMVETIKKEARGRRYDVVIGVSGGVDSSYLVHWAVQKGLRPLAVNFDNGWHSEIAVSNIQHCLEKMKVDLVTNVVDYDEMKDLLLSYLKAGLPWADLPTDMALVATLYEAAAKYKVKAIFVGNSFRTEGRQPMTWTHGDTRQLKYIQKKFGKEKIKTIPFHSPWKLLYFGAIRGIKMIRPFNYMAYDKAAARTLLEKEYSWRDYGGHHHESIFTKFAITYWLYEKFGIDKRRISYSAQIRSGLLNREKALELLSNPPYDPKKIEDDINYITKKLGISQEEFKKIWNGPNKTIFDYPSYLAIYYQFQKLATFLFKYIFPFKPLMAYELRKKKL